MDVTENTRLYRDLSEREAKIRRLVDANIVGIFVWDFEGRILEANDAFLGIIGYGRDDLAIGSSLDDQSGRRRTGASAMKSGCASIVRRVWGPLGDREGVISGETAAVVPVLVGAATFEEDGSQGVGFVIDLTELKRAERAARLGTEALRRSEARLAEAQRLTHIGVAAYNETAILYGSEETYRIWGFDPALGMPNREAVFQRIHPDDRGRLEAEVQRALGEKGRYSIGCATESYRPAGRWDTLSQSAYPITPPPGTLSRSLPRRLS